MSIKTQLTLGERVLFVSLLPVLVFRILITLATKPNLGNLHWRQLIALRFLQCQRSTLPPNILLWYIRRTSTGEAIQGYCASNGIPHRSVTLESAALDDGNRLAGVPIPPGVLHLLTPTPTGMNNSPSENKKTILYLHGGGFVNPLRPAAHKPFIMKICTASRSSQIAILEYALAPEFPYPAQLVQSVAALIYLLKDLSIPPEDIMLAGDSAGGQMIGALLAHLVRPSPYAVPVPTSLFDLKGGKQQIGTALFISPFTLLKLDEGSYDRNDGADYLDRKQMKGFEGAWAPKVGDVWADLCEGEGAKEVWNQVFRGGQHGQGIVRRAMITVGTGEVFLDCCRLFAGEQFAGAETVVVKKGITVGEKGWAKRKDLVYAECEGEVHVQVALDSAVRYDGGLMMGAVVSWLGSF